MQRAKDRTWVEPWPPPAYEVQATAVILCARNRFDAVIVLEPIVIAFGDIIKTAAVASVLSVTTMPPPMCIRWRHTAFRNAADHLTSLYIGLSTGSCGRT
jgi:hypothetical protein